MFSHGEEPWQKHPPYVGGCWARSCAGTAKAWATDWTTLPASWNATVPRSACAMRRTALSPAKRAEMRGDISGSNALPEPERVTSGKTAWQETDGRAQMS